MNPATKLKIHKERFNFLYAGIGAIIVLVGLVFTGIFNVSTARAEKEFNKLIQEKVQRIDFAIADFQKSTIKLQVESRNQLFEISKLSEDAKAINTETKNLAMVNQLNSKEVDRILSEVQDSETLVSLLKRAGRADVDIARLISKNPDFQKKVLNQLLPVGSIIPFAGENVPQGWLLCDGQLLQIEEFPRLFSQIRNSFGGGVDTFKIPDLKGRVPVGAGKGKGLSARTIATKFGKERHQLTKAEMPKHDHGWENHGGDPVPGFAITRTLNEEVNEFEFSGYPMGGYYSPVELEGNDEPFNLAQPSLVVNYIIKH